VGLISDLSFHFFAIHDLQHLILQNQIPTRKIVICPNMVQKIWNKLSIPNILIPKLTFMVNFQKIISLNASFWDINNVSFISRVLTCFSPVQFHLFLSSPGSTLLFSFLSFLRGECPTLSLDKVGGEHPTNYAGLKKLSRTKTVLSFFLSYLCQPIPLSFLVPSFFHGWRIPNVITGLISGRRVTD